MKVRIIKTGEILDVNTDRANYWIRCKVAEEVKEEPNEVKEGPKTEKVVNTLKHKGFIGTFNYIEDENIFYGKIEGITALVTFQGQSIPEIKEAFNEAVEDYLDLCKEVGKDAPIEKKTVAKKPITKKAKKK